MFDRFTDFLNQSQNVPTAMNHPNRSNYHMFMLKTKTTTVPTCSRPSLVPLKFAVTCSLSSGRKNAFQTNTNLNATANLSQTVYQPDPNIGPPATLLSDSSVATVNTEKTPCCNYTKFH